MRATHLGEATGAAGADFARMAISTTKFPRYSYETRSGTGGTARDQIRGPARRGCRFRWIASHAARVWRGVRRALLVVDVRAPGKAASQRQRERQRQRRRERTPVPGAPLVARRPQLAPGRGPRRRHRRARRPRLLGSEHPARARRPARRGGPLDLRSAPHAARAHGAPLPERAGDRALRRPARGSPPGRDPDRDAGGHPRRAGRERASRRASTPLSRSRSRPPPRRPSTWPRSLAMRAWS